MKRITKLEIENFRAFFEHFTIKLDNGQNLLIYGENGSGKSTLFKSLSNFLSSSQDKAFPFIRHHDRENQEGIISITFNDYDLATNTIVSNFGEVIDFASNFTTTDSEQFVKTAELTKGFLDYKVLLEVYNHREAKPNLFPLVINTLFKDFIPTHLGGTYPLGKRCLQLINKVTNAYTRQTYDYWDGVPELAAHEELIRRVLKEVFLQLNAFLIKYFKLNLRVSYTFTPLVATGWWREIPTVLQLDVMLNGKPITHQSDYLNEARLSALSVCLYLAVLKRNPQPIDYKILFLDDVFIGLDLSNRIPILEIIKNEFSDYHVFISTYDRHLYELAKRKFESEIPGKWKSIELYVGIDKLDNKIVDKPILVAGDSNYEKATQFLHNNVKPDYPAAANYFRKALEELIKKYIPAWETADSENTQLPDYQLTSLTHRTKNFLNKTVNDIDDIDRIIGLLPTLLHPLSHHDISSPVYKGELLIVERSINKLTKHLIDLDIGNNYKCCLEKGKRLKMTFAIDITTNHFSFYELLLKEPLVIKRNGTAQPIVSKVHIVADRCYGHNGAISYPVGLQSVRTPIS